MEAVLLWLFIVTALCAGIVGLCVERLQRKSKKKLESKYRDALMRCEQLERDKLYLVCENERLIQENTALKQRNTKKVERASIYIK